MMKDKIKLNTYILALCCALLTAGCYSAQQYIPVQTKAHAKDTVIYFFGDPVARKGDAKVTANGKAIGVFGSKSYLCWKEKPGTVNISVAPAGGMHGKALQFAIEVTEGQCCYYQLKRDVNTVKNPDYSFGAGLVDAIGSGATRTTGGSSNQPYIHVMTITMDKLSEEDAFPLLKKYNPPKIVRQKND
jgi:hypothetical protein